MNTSLATLGHALSHRIGKQFSLPSPLRGLLEAAIYGGVFLAAGRISLDLPVNDMLLPMLPVVAVMMSCMVASGVYRRDITNCIMNLYVHSAYAFVLATGMFLVTVALFLPDYKDPRFLFFFLFFAFFVSNTARPLMSGTDFMDGGGRRGN